MNWQDLVDGFRMFGGTIDNIIQKEGHFGLGLFPIDSSKPIELRVPDELLVDVENIELVDGNIFIKNSGNYPNGFDEWYHQFQKHFSWGAKGKSSVETFESELTKLPQSTLNLAHKHGLYNISRCSNPHEDINKIFERFIATRQIYRNNKKVLMPLLELVNHSAISPSWGIAENSIYISGRFKNEIFVRYSASDPLFRFIQYGFYCDEPMAFSVSLNFRHYNKNIVIMGGIGKEPQKPCEIIRKKDSLIILRPLLGCKYAKRKPRTLFSISCNNNDIKKADELFDKLIYLNRVAIVNLYKSIETEKSPLVDQLRLVCLSQLNMLTEHIGNN